MKKVIVFGTFDHLHKGHISFLQQAKRLADQILVVVARDRHVFAAKKRNPSEKDRIRAKNLRKLEFVDRVILGSKTHNFYRTLRSHKPDIVALGYDQEPSLWKLRRDLKRHRIKGLVLKRLRSYNPNIYKSSKLKNNGKV
jgi:FAD synthetase